MSGRGAMSTCVFMTSITFRIRWGGSQHGNESCPKSRSLTKLQIDWSKDLRSYPVGRIMYGPAYLDHIKPSGTAKPAKFRRRAERGGAPRRIAKPAANATVCGPLAPPPEFTDDKPPAGFQDARHFCDGSLGISNEAKHGHRKNAVKSRVIERQSFCLPLNEM